MLQKNTWVSALDNSGAHYCKIIGYKNLKGYIKVGATVIISIQKLQRFIMHSKARRRTFKRMQTGQIYSGIVCVVRYPCQRLIGVNIKFFSNGLILLKKKTKNPVGNRIFGPLSLDLRLSGYSRFLVICYRVI